MTRKQSAFARRRAQGLTPERNNGITVTRMNNTRLTPAETARIMEPCRAALAALRQARGTHKQWIVLCTACHVAEAIEDSGIYRGQREIIQEAEQVLHTISQRCGATAAAWTPRACTGPEITALADLVAAHARQVHELTYGEYVRQTRLAITRVASDSGQLVYAQEAGWAA